MGGSSGRSLGSGSSGAGRPKGGGPATGDECALRFEVDLEGVDPAVLATVAAGDVLDVLLVPQGRYPAVVARAAAGVVGTLSGFPRLALLIRCMEAGNAYSGTVAQRTANTCRVAVSRTTAP